jgi:3-oxoacyl-(acyl-carrier-protein) synthase
MAAVAAIYALQAGLVPPTPNTEPRDAECGDLEIVRDAPRALRGARVMVNAFGIGHNASVILSRP